MKVVSSQQMSQLESKAYRDGASPSDFMEEAGSGIALTVHDFIEAKNKARHIVLLCGKGNNAGDAYVAGTHLLHLDYEVTAYQLFPLENCTQLCKQNHFRFINDGGRVLEVNSLDEVKLPSAGVIIDGIFGTGFRGQVEEPIASIIKKANDSKLPIVAVDIPSGLNGETGQVEGEAIVAAITAFLGLPKTGFFLKDGWNHVGKLDYVDFGLSNSYIDEAEADLVMISPDIMRPMMPHIVPNRHKYQAGHVVGLSGSHNYPGAALLSSLAALRGGAGIVHLLYPEGMINELVAGQYELIKVPYEYSKPETITELMNRSTATYIGPGIGLAQNTRQLIRKVLASLTKPSVLDADALTIIAEEKIPFPSQAIITPHIGEFKQLANLSEITLDMAFLKKCQSYAEDHQVTLVLKGGPTFIFHPNEPIHVNPFGDPGMATAGSGDVLTGLIASLLAQGLTPHRAALLGVYLHGKAGEFAAEDLTSYCMIASDIISFFPDAFNFQNMLSESKMSFLS